MAPRRRPPTDTEPLEATAEQIGAMDRYLQTISDAERDAIGKLYGSLPEWMPEPILPKIRQDLASLRNADQSPERIAVLVAQMRSDQLDEVPGTVRDVDDFFKSVSRLANVQWALSLDKAAAIKELAGSSAAIGERTLTQRRERSAKGNATKKQQAEENDKRWLEIGKPLRLRHPGKPDSWLALQISSKSRDNYSTIRAALPRLGLQKKRIKKS